MSEIVNVQIDSIESNPFRSLDKYPYVQRKLDALKRSIADVGLWEGVIARKAGRGYALAFGHHRIEAARQSGLKRVPLVVRELTDEQMLQFMGRENMEDYNADFLVMLETWEAAVKFRAPALGKPQPIDIARLLGWTSVTGEKREERMTQTGKACAAGYALLVGGFVARSDLHELTVRSATEILTRAQARMEQIEKLGSSTKRPPKEIEQAKRHVGKAAVQTAKDVRAGKVAHRDVRGAVDVHSYRTAKDSKPTPLFAVFGRALSDSIEKMLRADLAADKLDEIVKVIGKVTLDDDKACVKRIDFELASLGERTEGWRKRLAGKATVVPLKLLLKEA